MRIAGEGDIGGRSPPSQCGSQSVRRGNGDEQRRAAVAVAPCDSGARRRPEDSPDQLANLGVLAELGGTRRKRRGRQHRSAALVEGLQLAQHSGRNHLAAGKDQHAIALPFCPVVQDHPLANDLQVAARQIVRVQKGEVAMQVAGQPVADREIVGAGRRIPARRPFLVVRRVEPVESLQRGDRIDHGDVRDPPTTAQQHGRASGPFGELLGWADVIAGAGDQVADPARQGVHRPLVASGRAAGGELLRRHHGFVLRFRRRGGQLVAVAPEPVGEDDVDHRDWLSAIEFERIAVHIGRLNLVLPRRVAGGGDAMPRGPVGDEAWKAVGQHLCSRAEQADPRGGRVGSDVLPERRIIDGRVPAGVRFEVGAGADPPGAVGGIDPDIVEEAHGDGIAEILPDVTGVGLVGHVDELIDRLRIEVVDDGVIVLRPTLRLAGHHVEKLHGPARTRRIPTQHAALELRRQVDPLFRRLVHGYDGHGHALRRGEDARARRSRQFGPDQQLAIVARIDPAAARRAAGVVQLIVEHGRHAVRMRERQRGGVSTEVFVAQIERRLACRALADVGQGVGLGVARCELFRRADHALDGWVVGGRGVHHRAPAAWADHQRAEAPIDDRLQLGWDVLDRCQSDLHRRGGAIAQRRVGEPGL